MELTVTALPSETPEQHMLRLGGMYNQVMNARVKALNSGLRAIHDQLCEVSKAVQVEQGRLLAVHPDLISLAIQ